MKKIFAVLFLITLTTVAFTSQASANPVNHSEYLIIESPDIVLTATVDVPKPSKVFNVTELSANYIANKEDVVQNSVIGTLINKETNFPGVQTNIKTSNYINFYKAHLPPKVGLAHTERSNNTKFVQIHLPYEVGLNEKA